MQNFLQNSHYALFVYLFFISYTSSAQNEMWGMTYWGGDGAGVVFKTDINGENQEVIYKFPGYANGARPDSYRLCLASNGKFYGTTEGGGLNNGGVIYEFDPNTNTHTKLYDFVYAGPNGSNPHSGVIQGSNGKLYGTTPNGGANSKGTMYEFDPATKLFTKLYDFDNANGHPSVDDGEVLQASNGNLYGVTSTGGSVWGVVFEFNLSTNVYKKLHTFQNTHYCKGLTELPNGKLYGVSALIPVQSGVAHTGCVYTIDLATGAFTMVYNFANSSIKLPWGRLALASDGKLYGTAYEAGTNNKGGLFRFDPADNSCTVLYNFDGTSSIHSTGLMQASNGKLYGMTTYLGNNNNGTIFEYDLTDNTYNVLYNNFDGINGRNSSSVLVQASNGKLYSTLRYGGNNTDGSGLIFEFNLSGNTYTPLYNFGDTFNGAYPNGSLLQATNGKIYGMTYIGGVNDMGVIFSIDPIQQTFTKLHDFELGSGVNPEGSLVEGADGKLYGLAIGGIDDKGILFQFDPSTNTYTQRYNFNGINGEFPLDESLIRASNGKLYGITAAGGIYNHGVIFEYDPSTNTCIKRFDFDGTNEKAYDGKLMQAADGKIYGTTVAGGINDKGILFEFNPTDYSFTKLHDFDDVSGSEPLGRMTQDTNGKLYGTTSDGGANNNGVFFELDPVTKTYTKLRDVGSSSGLLEASAGKIYGMTGSAIFEYNVNENTFTDKTLFNGANGSGWLNLHIYNTLCLVNPTITAAIEKNTFEHALTLYPNPTNGKFTVDLKKQYSEISVSIYAITGKLISKTINTNASTLNLEIEEMPGFYIIEIHTQEGNAAAFKVVKE